MLTNIWSIDTDPIICIAYVHQASYLVPFNLLRTAIQLLQIAFQLLQIAFQLQRIAYELKLPAYPNR